MKLIDPCKQCIVKACCRHMCGKAERYLYEKNMQHYTRGMIVSISLIVSGILGGAIAFLIKIYG